MLSGHAIDSETTVMIVENSPRDRRLLVDVCRDAGFALGSIYEFENLERAIPELNRGRVDLVLLDLALSRSSSYTLPAETLLDTWPFQTKNRKVPVIVVSRHAHVLKPKARAAVFEIIQKPGPGDGEKVQFSKYLEHVIREAISKRSEALTLWDRIRQQFDWVMSGTPNVGVDDRGMVVVHPTNPFAKAAVWLFALGFHGLALYQFAKNQGWPAKLIIGAFGAVLALWILLRVRGRKRRR